VKLVQVILRRFLSQIGLILLMFLVGLEFDFSHLRPHGHVAFSISLAGIILPFGLGVTVAQVLHRYVGQDINKLGFSCLSRPPCPLRRSQPWLGS